MYFVYFYALRYSAHLMQSYDMFVRFWRVFAILVTGDFYLGFSCRGVRATEKQHIMRWIEEVAQRNKEAAEL